MHDYVRSHAGQRNWRLLILLTKKKICYSMQYGPNSLKVMLFDFVMHMGGRYHYLSGILTYVSFMNGRIIVLIKLDYDSDQRSKYDHHAMKTTYKWYNFYQIIIPS